MARASELMGLGLPPAVAGGIGNSPMLGATAAGSTQADAAVLTGSFVVMTTVGSGTGVILPPAAGQPIHAISNGGANALKVYAFGSEVINAIAAASAFSVTNAKTGIFIPCGGQWIGLLSA